MVIFYHAHPECLMLNSSIRLDALQCDAFLQVSK